MRMVQWLQSCDDVVFTLGLSVLIDKNGHYFLLVLLSE